MKTYTAKPAEIERTWHVIDAEGQTLGRLASRIATLLKGKHKPIYTTHLDTGDFVIVINAAKIQVTGRKATQKRYYRHTQYPGGLRVTEFAKELATRPERVIERAVKGMLPHNRLGARMLRKLKVYAGPTHKHAAQVNAGQGKARAVKTAPPPTGEAVTLTKSETPDSPEE